MMKLSYVLLILTAILGLLLAWLINMDIIFGEDSEHTVTQQQLAINECDAIAGKSVAHLKVVVPYQQLEKDGRRARVMRLCMTDHQYQENPAWLAYAKPLASEQAKQDNQSTEATLEQLRREHMVMFNTPKNTPSYWQVLDLK